MRTTIEQIRTALSTYLLDNVGHVAMPLDLLELLEDADRDAKYKAEQIEGLLALFAGNKIHQNVLRKQMTDILYGFVVTNPMGYSPAYVRDEQLSTDAASTTLQRGALLVLAASWVGIAPSSEHEPAR